MAALRLATAREQQKSTLTLTTVAESFLHEHGEKLEARTREEYQRMIRQLVLPVLGNHPIDAINRAAVSKLRHSLARTPRQANHVLSVISKLMSWAAARGLLASETNPCRGIERYKENRRERFLSGAELSRLGEALRDVEEQQVLTPYAMPQFAYCF